MSNLPQLANWSGWHASLPHLPCQQLNLGPHILLPNLFQE